MNNARIRNAIQTAQDWLIQKPLYLDTETTGLGSKAQIVELALLDHDGTPLLDTLIRATVPIERRPGRVSGILDADLIDAPSFAEILPRLVELTKDRLVIIYNADFDMRLLKQSADARNVEMPQINAVCAMKLYALYCGDWDNYRARYRWQSQKDASYQMGLDLPADLYGAAAYAELCRRIVEAMANAEGEETGQETVKCTLCGKDTEMLGTKLCDPYWELQSRIKANPDLARKILAELDEEREG